MREAEKRGTGSSLFGGQNWAKRTIQLSNGTLSYSASAAEMAAGKVKKAPVSLLGYDVVEPFGSPAGISELHLVREGCKTIRLRVKSSERQVWLDELLECGAFSTFAKKKVPSAPASPAAAAPDAAPAAPAAPAPAL